MSGSPKRAEIQAAVDRLAAEPTQRNILAVLDAAAPVDAPPGAYARWMGPRLYRFVGDAWQPGMPLARVAQAVEAEARRRLAAQV